MNINERVHSIVGGIAREYEITPKEIIAFVHNFQDEAEYLRCRGHHLEADGVDQKIIELNGLLAELKMDEAA